MKHVGLLVLALCLSLSLAAQVVINEISAGNGDIIFDGEFFQFPSWIELYNDGNADVDISGYYLSDKTSVPLAWKIPANTILSSKAYLLIWCDNKDTGLHTNFGLNFDGEDVILSNAAGQVIDSRSFPKQYLNITYGRTSDGGSTWNFLPSPTPGAANIPNNATVQLSNPLISLKSGRYSGHQQVTLSHTQPGTVIRYTLDGSEPTANSTQYSDPIEVTATTTLKARAFQPTFLPSKTEVKTYFLNEREFSLPVVSLSTKPAYLWDNTIGIYTDGTNGKDGSCSTGPVNWYQNWFRHATFELFQTTGEKLFDYSVDIRIGGYCSRRRPQKSFVMKARDEYGSKTITENIFPNKPGQSTGGIFLRNSGTDWNNVHFRDAFMQSLVIGQMDIDYLDYQPSILFLNGEYWGIQNLREKVDADYIRSNHGVKDTDLDLLEHRETALEGTNAHFKMYLDSLGKIDLTQPEAIKFIDRYIDTQEFINYQVANIYFANTDWPGANIKWWRQRSNGGKFRWVLYDTDWGFAGHASSYPTHPTLEYVTAPSSTTGANPSWSTLHLRSLLTNPTFRTQFIQTLLTATGTTFRPERVGQFINHFQNRLKTEMPFHRQKWGGTMAQWNTNVDKLRIFSTERNPFMLEHIGNFFGYPENITVSVASTPESAGKVKLNEIMVEGEIHGIQYLKELTFKAIPVPNDGYTFKHWQITRQKSTAMTLVAKNDVWKFNDKGALPGGAWTDPDYNDDDWSTGAGQFGYGDGDETTVVSFGSSSSKKHTTTYFRKKITIPAIEGIDNIRGSVLFDDGVVIYFNGTEVHRANMPEGAIDFGTFAMQPIGDENAYRFFSIDKSLITEGENVISVEVHQESLSSGDLSFDLQLSAQTFEDFETITVADETLDRTADSDLRIVAIYETAFPVQNLVINEFSAAQTVYMDPFGEDDDWIELHNKGNTPIEAGGLFITDNLGNKTKHQIKSGTTETLIQPGGYLLLWADDDVAQGPTHLAFKLSADGEEIGLYQAIGNTIVELDKITFGKQNQNFSMSRIPNGSGSFFTTSGMTPGAENGVIASLENKETKRSAYPNPTENTIRITSIAPLSAVTVLDIFGKKIKTFAHVEPDQLLDLSDMPSGIYFFRIQEGDHHSLIKVIKR